MSLTRKWSDRSFFIELKPRTDQASLFLDFSPEEYATNGFVSVFEFSNFDGAILDMGINYIEYGEPVANCENVLPGVKVVEPDSFRVDFEGLELTPTTFSGGTWTQMKQRLFMCKLKAHSVPALGSSFCSSKNTVLSLQNEPPAGGKSSFCRAAERILCHGRG